MREGGNNLPTSLRGDGWREEHGMQYVNELASVFNPYLLVPTNIGQTRVITFQTFSQTLMIELAFISRHGRIGMQHRSTQTHQQHADRGQNYGVNIGGDQI